MGLRFRKSVKLGKNARVTFSKSGVSYSIGTKGYRVTKTAKGTIRKTASIPGTGVSFVDEHKINKHKVTTTDNTSNSLEASSTSTMINDLGQVKIVKDGFSWATLFFGPLVPLFRGDVKWFIIMFIPFLITCGVSNLIFAFMYNYIYIYRLQKKGYKFQN